MLRLSYAILYTALLLGANPAAAEMANNQPAAQNPDPAAQTASGQAAANALRDGDMRKLTLHDTARPVPETTLLDANDAPRSLADYRGKWVVLNFWATWCAPCRHEMPSLDRLQTAMGENLAVLPVATGRNPVPGIEKFFTEAGIVNLPILRDPKSELARAMGVMGLPVTVILNPEGQEIGRLIGDAEWDSESAKAVLSALMAGG